MARTVLAAGRITRQTIVADDGETTLPLRRTSVTTVGVQSGRPVTIATLRLLLPDGSWSPPAFDLGEHGGVFTGARALLDRARAIGVTDAHSRPADVRARERRAPRMLDAQPSPH